MRMTSRKRTSDPEKTWKERIQDFLAGALHAVVPFIIVLYGFPFITDLLGIHPARTHSAHPGIFYKWAPVVTFILVVLLLHLVMKYYRGEGE